MKMIIHKKWNESEDRLKQEGEPVGWFETSKEECIRHTEDNGYYKKGTVIAMLEEGHIIYTPWADYKIIRVDK